MTSNRRVMKRCFMNGKRCIFSSQVQSEHPKGSDKIFVIMPFTPKLKSFYNWKIKQLLAKKFCLKEEDLQIADEIRNIGYIICEKICNKIQTSDLILTDISLDNPNVFYELGLACGLQRPIILMRNKEVANQNKCAKKILDYFSDDNDIIEYRESEDGEFKLEFASSKKKFLTLAQHLPDYERKKRTLKISVLSFDLKEELPIEAQNDVAVPFGSLIKVAAEVAIKEIISDINNKEILEPWQQVMKGLNEETRDDFSKVDLITINCMEGPQGAEFKKVAEGCEKSFCIIIDIRENNPAAYFWLGYCHARGFNAIPVDRSKSSNNKPLRETKLAFDLRALWYAEFDNNDPYRFKDELIDTITHLMERDLPDWQRQAFWDRFPPESKLKVFTGAIHSEEHNREVVGDWDVRTVSELFSYLPSVREATNIELVTPLYSPEEAKKRVDEAKKRVDEAKGIVEKYISESDTGFIDRFCLGIEQLLEGSNAIVIASPDVNPVTEYLLHKIYNLDESCRPFKKCESPKFTGLVAVKRRKNIAGKKVNRLFYREEASEDGKNESRGFVRYYIDQGGIQRELSFFEPYKSQIDIDKSEEGFGLLGHLVVAHYPKGSDNWVLLLNGLSGPATFALSQILIGSGKTNEMQKRSISEDMLKQINDLLDKSGCLGAQAIVRVEINRAESPNLTYVDTRIVDSNSWEFYSDYKPNPNKIE